MELKEQIELISEMLDATKELNGEYQEGWDKIIEGGEKLLAYLQTELKKLRVADVSSSAWERKLVGKNIHSVLTWCKDCGMKGCNIPFEDECGNCGSKNTVRYYDKQTIDLLF